jgi:hypothetical protein
MTTYSIKIEIGRDGVRKGLDEALISPAFNLTSPPIRPPRVHALVPRTRGSHFASARSAAILTAKEPSYRDKLYEANGESIAHFHTAQELGS